MGRRQRKKVPLRVAFIRSLPPDLQKIRDDAAWDRRFGGRVKDLRYDPAKLRHTRVHPGMLDLVQRMDSVSSGSRSSHPVSDQHPGLPDISPESISICAMEESMEALLHMIAQSEGDGDCWVKTTE